MLYAISEDIVPSIIEYMTTRGGIQVGSSLNISNPQELILPLNDANGVRKTTQTILKVDRIITDPAEIVVIVSKEWTRFHVAVQMGRQGLMLKISDGGTRRIQNEIQKASAAGKVAWYVFDYHDENNAVIMVEDCRKPLTEYMK